MMQAPTCLKYVKSPDGMQGPAMWAINAATVGWLEGHLLKMGSQRTALADFCNRGHAWLQLCSVAL